MSQVSWSNLAGLNAQHAADKDLYDEIYATSSMPTGGKAQWIGEELVWREANLDEKSAARRLYVQGDGDEEMANPVALRKRLVQLGYPEEGFA